jgi:hydroxyacylglutathione hydrolase
LIVEVIVVGMFQVNCIVVADEQTKKGVVIDPGDEADKVIARVEELGLDIEYILLTHAHLDHVLGVAGVQKATGAKVLLHSADRDLYDRIPEQAAAFGASASPCPPPDGELTPGESVTTGGLTFEVLPTPGHSPGGVTFVWRGEKDGEGLVFPGDALFAQSIGRTDLWGGDFRTLISSIKTQLLSLPADYRVIPGHGPETTIGAEAKFNPFLTGQMGM